MVGTASITVFSDFLSPAEQVGQDVAGESGEPGGLPALSADGQVVAIASGGTDGAGRVRIYRLLGSTWVQLGDNIDGQMRLDGLSSVALSSDGEVVAIGASGASETNKIRIGHVRVFGWSGSAWTQQGANIVGEDSEDQSGSSVALSSDGKIVAIGARANDGSAFNAGHVRIYRWSGGAWTQQGDDIDGPSKDALAGTSLALSSDGQTVMIGAPLYPNVGTSTGKVRVYRWSGSAWEQRGEDVDGQAEDERLGDGQTIALSSDGNIFAVGAASFVISGKVRVYEWSGVAWAQLGEDIIGEAGEDRSGSSVALSSDGHAAQCTTGLVLKPGEGLPRFVGYDRNEIPTIDCPRI